jgi:hypothetical protein
MHSGGTIVINTPAHRRPALGSRTAEAVLLQPVQARRRVDRDGDGPRHQDPLEGGEKIPARGSMSATRSPLPMPRSRKPPAMALASARRRP